MTAHRAVLDFIGLPPGSPGHLECRLSLCTFRENGAYIDDGSRRPGLKMTNVHRFVLMPGSNVAREVDRTMPIVAAQGYDAPAADLMRHVARYEWRQTVIRARRARNSVKRPTLRLVVRALGFDVEGKGQLSVGLARVIAKPNGSEVTAKASILMQPGDDIEALIASVNAVALSGDFEPLCEEDQGLLRHVSARLWTPEQIERREIELADSYEYGASLGLSVFETRQLEFVQRIDEGLTRWTTAPVNVPASQPEPMRALN